VFAATVVVIAIPVGAFVLVAALVLRHRRSARARGADTDVIEAHHVGGHSWVAYGWDGRS
jgi:NAD(P)H-dependent flavin oxidoreductase YrpB (nitropropane dioxygenase family)